MPTLLPMEEEGSARASHDHLDGVLCPNGRIWQAHCRRARVETERLPLRQCPALLPAAHLGLHHRHDRIVGRGPRRLSDQRWIALAMDVRRWHPTSCLRSSSPDAAAPTAAAGGGPWSPVLAVGVHIAKPVKAGVVRKAVVRTVLLPISRVRKHAPMAHRRIDRNVIRTTEVGAQQKVLPHLIVAPKPVAERAIGKDVVRIGPVRGAVVHLRKKRGRPF